MLNYDKIDNHPERVSKLRPYISYYNWSGIYFPVDLTDWKKFEKNNKSVALNIFFVPNDRKDIRLAYKSEYNGKRKNKVILLMIDDGEKWQYLAVKIFSRLFRGISSNHDDDHYCLGCFHSYSTAKKL